MIPDCKPSLFRRNAPHNFQPRFDNIVDLPVFNGRETNISIQGGGTVAEKFGNKVYVRDICTRCGHVIERTVRD